MLELLNEMKDAIGSEGDSCSSTLLQLMSQAVRGSQKRNLDEDATPSTKRVCLDNAKVSGASDDQVGTAGLQDTWLSSLPSGDGEKPASDGSWLGSLPSGDC